MATKFKRVEVSMECDRYHYYEKNEHPSNYSPMFLVFNPLVQ